MWSVLEAIYDGPIDTVGFESQPVILKNIPDFDNGGAILSEVELNAGEMVLNSDGDVVTLIKGTTVFPAGCKEESCAVNWDGESPLFMNQLSLTYTLIDNLKWSDGEPLTASDSVYAYQVANDPGTPVNRYYLDRTLSYLAVDETSVVWTGIPGFNYKQTGDLFWAPFPQHAWKDLSAAELLTDPLSTTNPIGWGPYQISKWVKGSHIEMVPNENYFRANEGLPHFQKLVFQFLGPHADSNLKALEIKECDLVDATVSLDEQLVDVVERSNLGQIKAYFGLSPEWEHLDFGILSSAFDDGFQITKDRPDWFGDVRMRQAFAYCTDRQSIVNQYFVNRSVVPATFIPPSHPDFDASLSVIPYDVSLGSMLLEQIGWRDDDDNADTPRVAYGVANVPDGTPLVLDYVTTQSTLRLSVSLDLAKSVSACGIELVVRNVAPTELYAPGPQGIMFGRNFDLAQFTWQSGRNTPCFLYTSKQIPAQDNLWVGTNVSGYQNDIYDQACLQTQILDDNNSEEYHTAIQTTQKIFNQELPVLPLYYQIKAAASREDFCGFEPLDVSARSVLYGIENFDYGDDCLSR
jgi:peptide/nickel transport system substrate-binding protein